MSDRMRTLCLGAAFGAIFLAGLVHALTDPADQQTHLGAAFFYGFMFFALCVDFTLSLKGKL